MATNMVSWFVALAAFLVMAVITIIRMTLLADAEVYHQNALMNANPFFLGMLLIIFGLFNAVFIGGFFKTAYKLSPFITYIISAFVAIGIAEALHHVPGFGSVNAFGFDDIMLQLCLFAGGAVIFLVLTYLSYKKSCANFERIDL